MSWTADEIASQPEMWARASTDSSLGSALTAPGERVLAIGCGTSAFMAQAYAALRESADMGETDWAYAAEAPLHRRYDRVVAITRSGTTTEVLDALRAARPGSKRVAVSAVRDEAVTDLVDDAIVLDFADERSVVQTRFPTTFLALVRASLGEDLSPVIERGRVVVTNRVEAPAGIDHFVFLGSGTSIGLAHEAALKIRESAQAWSESYPAMDYRHGPIAVARRGSLVTMFGTAPAGLADAVRATGAEFVEDDDDPMLALVRAQLLAVALAEARGLDPDRPRALTRSVVLAPA